MVLKPGRIATAAALTATLAMPVTHAAAADLTRLRPATVEAYDSAGDNADGWRRRHRHDDGVDAGDIIAGILVLGGIAAIASAVSRDDDEPRERYPRDARYDTPGEDESESRGLARAIDMCVAEVERGRERVSSVEDASRDASGWEVSGVLEGGAGFTCRIGNDGRIDDLSVGPQGNAGNGAYADRSSGDPQYSDETYERLRAAQSERQGENAADYSAPADDDIYDDDPRPAYPGGPLPGEEGYDESIAAQDYGSAG
jgi:hypothetical protein